MAKVYLICGRLCSGKTTYAEGLDALLLSTDELMLTILGDDCGDKHDEYVKRTQDYLCRLALRVLSSGTNVALDWGFWTRASRDNARRFFTDNGISYEFRLIDISTEEHARRIEKRNKDVTDGRTSAYYVDEGLAAKAESLYQAPTDDETDIVRI